MATPSAQPVFSLRITLDEVTPTLWRRLLVPGGIRLGKLHDVFQTAMGWTNSHLHCFTIGSQRFGPQFDDYPEDEVDENAVTVLQAIGEHRRFSYEYDFGDLWEHHIVVEEHVRLPHGLKHAVQHKAGGDFPVGEPRRFWRYMIEGPVPKPVLARWPNREPEATR